MPYCSFSNEELTEKLFEITKKYFQIIGEEPYLYECPCCGKKTLLTHAEYDICSNCLWEDDGIEDVHKYSTVNHMTLEEGKLRYKNNKRV